MNKFFALLALSAVCSAPVIAKDSEKPEAAIVDLSPKLPKPPPKPSSSVSHSSDSSETTTGENSSVSEVSKVPLTDPMMAFPPPTSARGNKPLPADWKLQNAEVDMPIPKDWNEQ